MAILFSTTTSCKKQKEVGKVGTPIESKKEVKEDPKVKQNANEIIKNETYKPVLKNTPTLSTDFLYSVKNSSSNEIWSWNLSNGTTKSIGFIPFQLGWSRVTSDGKNVIFLHSYRRNVTPKNNMREQYNLFRMNIDGTNIRRLTNNMNIQPYGEGTNFNFCITPDNKEVVISLRTYENGLEYYLINIENGQINQIIKKNSQYYVFDSFFDQLFEERLSYRPKQDDYLVWNNQELPYPSLGFFSWTNKTYTMICSSPNSNSRINSAFWTPNFEQVIFSISGFDENGLEDNIKSFYLYDLKSKKNEKIATIDREVFGNKELQVIDHNRKIILKSAKTVSLYDIGLKQTKEIKTFKEYTSLKIMDETKVLLIDGDCCGYKRQIYWFDLDKNILEELFIPTDSQSFFWFQNTLFFFTDQGLAKYNFQKKEFLYIAELKLTNIELCKFIPDKQLIYLVASSTLYVLDITGKLQGQPFANISCSTGRSSGINRFSDNELTFFSIQYGKKDIYYSSPYQKNPENLTLGKYDQISNLKVSEDKEKVAFYAVDYKNNLYTVNVIDLKNRNRIQTLFSFPCEKMNWIAVQWNAYFKRSQVVYPDSYFLKINWSPDSQYLLFTVVNKKGNASINRIRFDGTDFKLLSNPDIPSFSPNISPDGKNIVYISGLNGEITLMDSDGSNKRIISKEVTKSRCFFPSWAPDGNWISFLETGKTTNIKIISNKGKLIKNIECNYYEDRETYYEMLQTNNFWSISMDHFAYLKKIDNSRAGEGNVLNEFDLGILKNLSMEEMTKSITHRFKWSRSDEKIMLFSSVFICCYREDISEEREFHIYDCLTKQNSIISKDVVIVFDACWSPDGKQILYSGTDTKTGQIVFKTTQADGSNQKLLFTFSENPLERPSSIENIEKLIWLK
jgi:Tol biopolymer transport system component